VAPKDFFHGGEVIPVWSFESSFHLHDAFRVEMARARLLSRSRVSDHSPERPTGSGTIRGQRLGRDAPRSRINIEEITAQWISGSALRRAESPFLHSGERARGGGLSKELDSLHGFQEGTAEAFRSR
jgi:hypothetical protein